MIVPPKYSKVYTVESSSSAPDLGGFLEIKLSADGVAIRWAGEAAWKQIDWWEVAIHAEAPGSYRDVIEAWKTQAFEEGLMDGIVADTRDEDAVLNYAEKLKQKRGECQSKSPTTDPLNAG